MKTSRLLTIVAAAAVLMCTAPAAIARPAADPAGARTSVPTASTPASIALHHEQMSQQQYLASRGAGAPAEPLVDGTETDARFPVVFVLAGIAIPLSIGLAALAARPFTRHRRPPASVS